MAGTVLVALRDVDDRDVASDRICWVAGIWAFEKNAIDIEII